MKHPKLLIVSDTVRFQWIKKQPQAPRDASYSHHQTREVMSRLTQAALQRMGPSPPGISETHHDITLRDGFTSKLRITRPTDPPNGPGPLVVLIFGGGFVGGDVDQLSEAARLCAQLFSATAVCTSYRLAPEYKWPKPQYDTFDSLRWIVANASGPLLNADPTKGFVLGGVSAGAALTAVSSRFFQDPAEALPHPLTGQWLCVPSVMTEACVPAEYKELFIARRQNADAPFLNADALRRNTELLEPDETSPLRYAVNATTPLAEQPRTYVQVDGLDPLRDDGIVYEDMLRKAGAETRLDMYPGVPHGHMFGMRETEIGKKGLIDVVTGMAWLLRREVSVQEAKKALGI